MEKMVASTTTKTKAKKEKKPELIWLNLRETLKSPMTISLATILFVGSLIIGIVFSTIYKKDSITSNWITFPLIEMALMLVIVTIFDIYYLTRNFVNAKLNGITDVEISSGIDRKLVVFSRLINVIAISSILILLGILFYFLPVGFSRNATVKMLGNRTATGLLVMNAYNFILLGIGLLCSLTKKVGLFAGLGSAIVVLMGLSPIWSLLANNNIEYSTNNTWTYKMRDELNENKKKYSDSVIDALLEPFEYSYMSANNYGRGSNINNIYQQVTFNQWTFNSNSNDGYLGTNGYIYYALNMKDLSPELQDLKEVNGNQTMFYTLLSIGHKTMEKQISENDALFHNKTALWGNSEFSFEKDTIDLSNPLGIFEFLDEFKVTINESQFSPSQKEELSFIIKTMKQVSLATLTEAQSSGNYNSWYDNDNPNYLYITKNLNPNVVTPIETLNNWVNSEYIMTPGFRSFSLLLSLIVSSNFYIADWSRDQDESHVTNAINKRRTFLYIIPPVAFTQSIIAGNNSKMNYFDLNSMSTLDGMITQTDYRWDTKDQDGKSITSNHKKIYFNKFLGMFVYWLIGVGLIALGVWLFYRKLVI